MRDWLKYDKGAIFRDKSKGGLLSIFLKEYKEQFGGSINPSCRKCLNSYYGNYINSLNMSELVKCDYELHAKYNGIQLGANGQPIRNGEMTNKKAKELLEKHPHGAKLFVKIPEVKEIEVVETEIVKPKRKRTTKKAK